MKKKTVLIIVLAASLSIITTCTQKRDTDKVKSGDYGGQAGVKNDSGSPLPPEINRGTLKSISVHEAALNGLTADIEKMIAEGTDIDIKDEDGRTPLMYASFNGHSVIMQKLISKGAKVNQSDNYGRTALMFASSGPYPEAVRLLLKNQADPNLSDKEEHFTALMYAAAEGQTEIVKILLTFKADPRKKDIDGDDALTFARNNGHNDIVNINKTFLR